MGLNPQVIGKEMPHGFAGCYARQPDMIVETRPAGGETPIPFGTPLVYDTTKPAVVAAGASFTAAVFAGVAGCEIKSALTYLDQQAGQYAPGEPVSVFQRGSINVKAYLSRKECYQMATKPIPAPLLADLPEDWTVGQTVAPTGEEVGLTQQHGYNYLMEKVNEAIQAINALNEGFEDVGGFVEMEASLPVGDRVENTLYGLILVDFSG